ncbi:MAG: DUF3786 domain-containing protein [Thermodesulfobacteriota bacterium]
MTPTITTKNPDSRISLAPDEYTMWLERVLTGKNQGELVQAYDMLLTKVKRIDPLTLAEETGGRYLAEGVPRILVPFLHSWFVLTLVPYRVKGEHEVVDTLPLKVLFLQHLLAAGENHGSAVKVMGTWIDCRSLQHGAVLGAHFSRSVSNTLGAFFSLDRPTRISRAMQWGGRPVDLGEEGFLFDLFPRVPVALIHWFGDDEFPAFSKVLFDVSASNFMPTHGLTALTEFLVHRIVEG